MYEAYERSLALVKILQCNYKRILIDAFILNAIFSQSDMSLDKIITVHLLMVDVI